MHGALLIQKPAGISSFGVIEQLQRELRARTGIKKRKDLPKLGHGGTLDPFATGLIVVCVGKGVKLARYFLGSTKSYRGTMRFGQTTVPGDPTSPITETSQVLPDSLAALNDLAARLCLQPYLQTPPMHSAKKVGGVALYELAREGIEVEREAKLCQLSDFVFSNLETDGAVARADFSVSCTSGTYIRTLAQDFARMVGTVGMLETLHRDRSGSFLCTTAFALEQIASAMDESQPWDTLSCWIPFDRLLDGYPGIEARKDERDSIFQGRQKVLTDLFARSKRASSVTPAFCPIYCSQSLIAVARAENGLWELERVFTDLH